MKKNEFFYILHLLIHGQAQPSENLRYHSAAHSFMAMEGPSDIRIKFFGYRFGDIMQQRGPTQPQIIGGFGEVIKNLKGVIEIVFVAYSLFCLSTFER